VAAAKWLIDFVTIAGTKRDKLDISVLVGLFTRVMTQVVAIVPCQQDGILLSPSLSLPEI
jgi:hypothetical protein